MIMIMMSLLSSCRERHHDHDHESLKVHVSVQVSESYTEKLHMPGRVKMRFPQPQILTLIPLFPSPIPSMLLLTNFRAFVLFGVNSVNNL